MQSTMTCDHVATAEAEDGTEDGLSGLPDDVLLDIVQRLVNAGDVCTAARTCILSRRWRHLPRYNISNVSLDVGDFIASTGWFLSAAATLRRRKEKDLAYQHHASGCLVQALWYFLEAPPSARVIETLKLKMVLTKYELLRRAGRLIGEAARSGRLLDGGAVELELVTEMRNLCDAKDAPAELMLGYGARFTQLLRGCPRAFRALTRLVVENLWFHDAGAVTDLVRRCPALEFLSMRYCAFEDPEATMVVDAPPESCLRTLLCLECDVPGVALVQAPSLVEFHCGWRSLVQGAQPPPASFGLTPELKKLTLHYQQYDEKLGDDLHAEWRVEAQRVSHTEPRQLEVLTLSFEATKIWVQPELPGDLRAILGGLKELHLEKIHPTCNLSWAIFLLEASPLLETLHIEIFNHACHPDWHKKLYTEPDTMAPLPRPGFTHHHLKDLTIARAFHVAKDMPFVRVILEAAMNLEKLTLGVKDLGCEKCAVAVARRRALARSRLMFRGASRDVDIATSARIEVF